MPRQVLFEHIPKTAGSTLHFILMRQYRETFYVNKNLNPLDSFEEFYTFPPEKQKSFPLIHGHASLILEPLLEKPFCFTFFREPVEQLLSQYHYIRRAQHHVSHSVVSKLHSLDDYLHYARDHYQDNLHTRVLARDTSWITGQNGPPSPSMDQLLESALMKLEALDLVLLTSQFDASVLMLKEALGWEKNPYYVRMNVTHEKPELRTLSPSTKAQLEEFVRHDRHLYDHARKLFNEQQQVSEEEVLRFQQRNRFFRRWIFPFYRLQVKLRNEQIE
ncbi:MAG: hypothetical protein GC180_00780 [Bacteroidetes bacterium]|nr:hypothetical protein [Bacteroidota bacterium]